MRWVGSTRRIDGDGGTVRQAWKKQFAGVYFVALQGLLIRAQGCLVDHPLSPNIAHVEQQQIRKKCEAIHQKGIENQGCITILVHQFSKITLIATQATTTVAMMTNGGFAPRFFAKNEGELSLTEA